eukprot:5269033-Prymnesium_polylepis.1
MNQTRGFLKQTRERDISCPCVLLLFGDENWGLLDPWTKLRHSGDYHGCTWDADAADFRRVLDGPLLRGALYRQTPPIEHPKLRLVPLGPSQGFVSALIAADATSARDAQRAERARHPVPHEPLADAAARQVSGRDAGELSWRCRFASCVEFARCRATKHSTKLGICTLASGSRGTSKYLADAAARQ